MNLMDIQDKMFCNDLKLFNCAVGKIIIKYFIAHNGIGIGAERIIN